MSHPNNHVKQLVLACAGGVAALWAASASAETAVPDLTTAMEDFGNPNVSYWRDAPTSRNVTAIGVHGGRLLVSGGEWNSNTGPCPVFAVDPSTGDFEVAHTAGTERVDFYRAGTHGHVFIPSIDPHEKIDTCCDVTRLNPDGTWTILKTAPKVSHDGTLDDSFHSIHTFDAVVWKGQLFTAGYGLAVGPELSTSRLVDAAPDITTAYYNGTLDNLRRFEALLPFEDDLIAVPVSAKSTGRRPSYWSFDEDEYEEFRFNEASGTFVRAVTASANVSPDLEHADFKLFSATADGVNLRLWNPVAFNGRVLYTLASEMGRPVGALFSAACVNHHVKAVRTNLERGAVPFCTFVRGNVVCVVAATYDADAKKAVNSVWESTDGVTFTKKFTFTSPHHASALAYFDGYYFFAMGARSVVDACWTYQGADISGRLYRVRDPDLMLGTVDQDMTAQGDWEIDVPGGDCVTVTVPQTGSGKIVKSGLGTLVLQAANSTFTGGVEIQAGRVRAEADQSLGTGTVTVLGQRTGFSGLCELDLGGAKVGDGVYPPTLTIDNAIHVVGDTDLAHPAIRGFYQNIVLNGDVTADGDFACLDDAASATEIHASNWNRFSTVRMFTFNGSLAVDGTFLHHGSCSQVFNGNVSFGAFDAPYLESNFNARYTFNGTVACSGDWQTSRWLVFAEGATIGGTLAYTAWHQYTVVVVGAGKTLRVGALATDGTTRTASDADKCWYLNRKADQGGVGATGTDRTLVITGLGPQAAESVSSLLVGGVMPLTLDAPAGFVQTFTDRVSTMNKAITVTSGTLKLTGTAGFPNATSLTVGADGAFIDESTAAGALAGVTSVTIEGSFASAGQPFANGVTMDLGADASLSLGADASLSVQALTVDGVAVPVGTHVAGAIGPIKSGTITVLTGPEPTVKSATWTGAGNDTRITTGANWSPAVNVASETFLPTFASGGSVATFDAHATLAGILFSATAAQKGFTLERGGAAGSITLDGPAITVGDPYADTPATYAIDVPMTRAVEDRIVLTVPTNKTLALTGGLTTPGSLTLEGEGALALAGTNLVEGVITVTNKTLTVSGLLAAPGRNDQGQAREVVGTKSITSYGCSGEGGGIVLDNAVIEKPIYVDGEAEAASPIRARAGTTNLISGNIRFACNRKSALHAEQDAELELSGGVIRTGTGLIQFGPGTVRVTTRSLVANQANGYRLDEGRLVLATENNDISRLSLGYYDGNKDQVLEFAVSDALNASGTTRLFAGVRIGSCILLRSTGTATVEFHATTQRVAQVTGSAVATFRGDAGSRLEICGDQSHTSGASSDIAAGERFVASQIAGALSVQMGGTGTLLLTSQDFASTGDLAVTNGVLELAADASWTNGAHVVVSDAGCLKLNAPENLSRDVTHLDVAGGGTVDVPAGVKVGIARLTVNGARRKSGFYTAANSSWLIGGGTVVVGNSGFVLVFR